MSEAMPEKKLLDLFFLHIRNLWRVDGHYFLGIEEKFGTEAATEIDTNCWRLMGKIEARDLKALLEIERKDAPSLMHALRHTSWALDQRDKEVEISETKGIFSRYQMSHITNKNAQRTRDFPMQKREIHLPESICRRI